MKILLYKIKLINQVATSLDHARAELRKQLAMSLRDATRYNLLLRNLRELSLYEYQILEKINRYDPDPDTDWGGILYDIQSQIKTIANDGPNL